MKGIFLAFIVVSLLGCSSIDSYEIIIPESSEFQNIVDAPDVSRGVLFSRGISWLDSMYGNNAGLAHDRDKGSIKTHGLSVVRYPSRSSHARLEYRYDVVIDTKDERSRLKIMNFNGKAYNLPLDGDYQPPNINEIAAPIMRSFEVYMVNGKTDDMNSNW